MGINRLPRYLLAAVLALSLSLSGAGGAAAQDKKPEIERKERASMMGERAYRRFESVQTLYSDGEYQEALGNLDAMTKMALNDYEKAMAQYRALSAGVMAQRRPGWTRCPTSPTST